MYTTIDAIKSLREKKLKSVQEVYSPVDPESVYQKQPGLTSMASSIYTDAANVMLPALKEDGASALVWSNVSGKLDKLNFIGIPSASEMREEYGKTMKSAKGDPKEKDKASIRNIDLRLLLIGLAAAGIAISLSFTVKRNGGIILFAVLIFAAGGAAIVQSIVHFDLFGGINSKREAAGLVFDRIAPNTGKVVKNQEVSEHWNDHYRKAIEKVKDHNLNELNRWFDNLIKLTEKELEKTEGSNHDERP